MKAAWGEHASSDVELMQLVLWSMDAESNGLPWDPRKAGGPGMFDGFRWGRW
jgi:hypothetical protein